MINITQSTSKKLIFTFIMMIFQFVAFGQKGVIVPSDDSQADFLKMYKFILAASDKDYRFTSTTMDTLLFPKFGESSIYRATSGINKGSFVVTDTIPVQYNSVSSTSYTNYDWKSVNHQSIQFKLLPKTVAIFQSNITLQGGSINWQSFYFRNIFDSYLFNSIYYMTNELDILSGGISDSCKLFIIPAFTEKGNNVGGYIDSIFTVYSGLKTKIDAFLSKGGTIYAEGNAVYFLEKLGYLSNGSVSFSNQYFTSIASNNLADLTMLNSNDPVSFAASACSNKLYAISLPNVTVPQANVIAKLTSDNRPVLFRIPQTNGGKIICNTGLATTGGFLNLSSGSRQLQWTFDAFLAAFSNKIDVTRSIFNKIPNGISVGRNGVSFDALDSFEVRLKIRNLSGETISNIDITETIRDYFDFQDVLNGTSYTLSGKVLTFSGISLNANTEKEIVYRLRTPDPTTKVHENVDNYISWNRYIFASQNATNYSDFTGKNTFNKYRNYTDVMMGARIVADADVNWKNFLNLDYQPFKVFMIMENKERTSAEQTKYFQYVPKDVPYYWVDHSINIPILKTPGGKFVTVMKGSNNAAAPDYDMDSDGKPDAWLDTATIYPKGYVLTEEQVYWKNPWSHLNGATAAIYEDIDGDGLRAQDTNNDGIIDVEEPGDKIRVWKITWNIDRVPGYQSYDPYCSYELWLDPPDLVPLAKGVGYVNGFLPKDNSMFYPFTPDITSADITNKSWEAWMEKDNSGNVIWKNLIHQKQNNYEGFTFVDNSYTMLPSDQLIGKVPQPRREFIAVVSLGGEEIDMTHSTSTNSQYSKITYKTIFNEEKTTPMRTTYTYYAPLPNPLQFEYLTNNYLIKDSLNVDTLQFLPEWGKANLYFDMDASTEYTYYWIRNVGHDVDYNDPSTAVEGIESLGDGVFGYMVYEIPKGYGGYKITLPKKADGTYDIASLVQVDGKPFEKWLDNPNTQNAIDVWETPFTYQIYIPQVLIPPALDDDNGDGKDDWIDDRGDRYSSNTGYLHDAFMIGNGENFPAGSANVFSHDDYGYGTVNQGWSAGADNTYGDDKFENLGKTHLKIHAIYEGKGKEGPIEISKGGTLVVEEIFGGSPWVINSHVLSGYSKGMDVKLTSSINPPIVKFGKDTTYIKHVVEDLNEPHQFNSDFDPYLVSYGFGNATATTYLGGKDPCSLISPAIQMPSIIDLQTDKTNVTLIPLANASNPDLAGFPKSISGVFVEVKIEINNGTDENWLNTTVEAKIPAALKHSKVVLSYVAYPRPLVPAKYDAASGKITPGDQIGTFKAGWRFNQPENEVLVKMGNVLNLMQPTRRAYFVFLIQLDETLKNGVYTLDFTLNGQKMKYNSTTKKSFTYAVPSAQLSITDKNSYGNVLTYQNFVIGQGSLTNVKTTGNKNLKGLQSVKWSLADVNHTDFATMTKSLPSSASGNNETIDLSSFKLFPTADTTKLFILEKVQLNTSGIADSVITSKEEVNYTFQPFGNYVNFYKKLSVYPIGPMVEVLKTVYSINNKRVTDTTTAVTDSTIKARVDFEFKNIGTDMAQSVSAIIYNAMSYRVVTDSLPANFTLNNNKVSIPIGVLIPGQSRKVSIYYTLNASENSNVNLVIPKIELQFDGTFVHKNYKQDDIIPLNIKAFDFNVMDLKYEKIDNSKIKITATALNRGTPAKNIKFTIYPVQSGIAGAAIGETQLNLFNTMQTVELTGEYLLANATSDIDFIAKIDKDEVQKEIYEANNARKITFAITPTTGINDIDAKSMKLATFPNPFEESVTFEYTLLKKMDAVTIRIFKLDGSELAMIKNCPAAIGKNQYTWHGLSYEPGVYLYEIQIHSNNETSKISGKVVRGFANE